MAFITESKEIPRLEIEARGYKDLSLVTQLSRERTEDSGPLGPHWSPHDPPNKAVGMAALLPSWPARDGVETAQNQEPSPGLSSPLQPVTEELWPSLFIPPDSDFRCPSHESTCGRSPSSFSSLRVPRLVAREQTLLGTFSWSLGVDDQVLSCKGFPRVGAGGGPA